MELLVHMEMVSLAQLPVRHLVLEELVTTGLAELVVLLKEQLERQTWKVVAAVPELVIMLLEEAEELRAAAAAEERIRMAQAPEVKYV